MNVARAKRRIAALAILFAIVSGLLGITILSAPMASSPGGSIDELPPPPRPAMTPGGPLRHSRSPIPRAASASALTEPPTITSGTWTPLNNTPSFDPAGVFLLTDGRVLVQDGTMTNVAWWTLTPDNTGSYINGTWTEVSAPSDCPNGYTGESADTVYSPLYYGSAVLPDGRFVMIGGEYNYDYHYVPNSGSEVWTDQGAIYDPVANSWTCISAPTGWKQIGDAQSVVLPNGTFMIARPFNPANSGNSTVDLATLNTSTNPPTFNSPFTPTGKSADTINDEEGWELLPNGTVLTLEVWNSNDNVHTPALTYNSSTKAWSSAGTAPDPACSPQQRGNPVF